MRAIEELQRRRPRRKVDPIARTIAAGIGAVRVAIGIGMLIAPRASLAGLGFRGAEGPIIVITRLAGGRDVALGALALAALDDRRRLRELSLASAGVDAADAASFAIALIRREGPDVGAGVGVVTATQAAIVGAWVARRLED
jgi:hypothetical protein